MKGILKSLLLKFAIVKRAQDSCVKIFGEMLDLHNFLCEFYQMQIKVFLIGDVHKICNLETDLCELLFTQMLLVS